jgi:hypothetical protein
MPHIFFRNNDGRWETESIAGSRGLLSLAPVRFDPACDGGAEQAGACLLARIASDEAWVLVLGAGQRLVHNGQPVPAGLRVLTHKDSLALQGREAVYFSTEEAARIEPFAGSAKVTCPRCRGEILAGQPAVKCPGCGVVHHEIEDRNCWTYAKTCALCAQPTVLGCALQWSPEAL